MSVEPSQGRRLAGEGEGVWVVDGDESVGRSLKLLLGTLDADVEVFRSAEAALLRLETQNAAFLISEVHLPGMSGIDLLREMRRRGIRVPVMMMATHADVPLAVEAMRLGALDFIEKPVVDRVILTRVREALSRPAGPGHREKGTPAHG